jgi:hypothetical protein
MCRPRKTAGLQFCACTACRAVRPGRVCGPGGSPPAACHRASGPGPSAAPPQQRRLPIRISPSRSSQVVGPPPSPPLSSGFAACLPASMRASTSPTPLLQLRHAPTSASASLRTSAFAAACISTLHLHHTLPYARTLHHPAPFSLPALPAPLRAPCPCPSHSTPLLLRAAGSPPASSSTFS